MTPGLSVHGALGETWRVYRLLWRRSIAAAAVVYAAIALVDEAVAWSRTDAARVFASLLSVVLGIAGPLLVQGALVGVVRDVHEARVPPPIGALLARPRARLPSLLGASLLYGVGVVVGLVLLVVPGLLAAARWALMAPAIVLEDRWTFPARDRSREIVTGEIDNGLGDRTWTVLGVVATSSLFSLAAPELVAYFVTGDWPDWLGILTNNAIAVIVAPFQAHLLSVLYYRLTEPSRPVVDPTVWSWPSVWQGPRA